MTRLFAGFSKNFDETTFNAEGFDGLIVASPDEMAGCNFTEAGFDTVDHDSTPDIREVAPTEALNYADYKALDLAATAAGIEVFMSEATQREMFPSSPFRPLMRNFNSEPNELLEHVSVRSELEAMGFDAFRGHITVGIDSIDATILWRPDTFTLSGPVPLITEDENFPSEVTIDFDTLSAAPNRA